MFFLLLFRSPMVPLIPWKGDRAFFPLVLAIGRRSLAVRERTA